MSEIKLEDTEINTKKVLIILGVTISAVVAFFNMVIIPLNQIQTKLASIQTSLDDNKKILDDVTSKQNDQDKRIYNLESIVIKK